MKYTEIELASAIEDLITLMRQVTQERGGDLANLREKHKVIDEIYKYGPHGPAGIGLGCYGGHAIGD